MALSRYDYTVACVCPMGVELAPVQAVLDEVHPNLPTQRDQNSYLLGRMEGHHVVVTVLPAIGNNTAAIAATQLLNDFPSVRFALLVGIGGGIPDLGNDVDIRLGDIVVGKPTKKSGGVVQYDLGKETLTGFERVGALDKPPAILMGALQRLIAKHDLEEHQASPYVSQVLAALSKKNPKYRYPGAEQDLLFSSSYDHQGGKTCLSCSSAYLVNRALRSNTCPVIHYGTIGSANRVLKNAAERDKLKSGDLDVLCVDMEAAGLAESLPCLVIRGICDYADSHKNKQWQSYAAAAAAAYMKEVLSVIPAREISTVPPAFPMIQSPGHPKTRNPVHWNIPRAPNTLFTGREEIINELETLVRDAVENPSSEKPCWIVISAIGGQGKSELCLQLAQRVRRLFWGLFWVDVSTPSLAENGFVNIATKINIPAETGETARQSLATLGEPWFLVLDNADDISFDYQQYFPATSLGVVLLTSRNAECRHYATSKWIDLTGLSDIEARDLLLRASRSSLDQRQSSEEDAQVVAQLLQSHPLALIQASSYISRGHCSLKDYPKAYHRQRKRLLGYRPAQAQSRYGDVYATFEASAEGIESLHTESANDALQLLSCLASMAPSRVPLSLFEAAWWQAHAPTSHNGNVFYNRMQPWHISHLPPFINATDDHWDSFRLNEAIRVLQAFSLVSTEHHDDSSTAVSMHPLIHGWASDRLSRTDRHTSWLMAGCLLAVPAEDSLLWEGQGRQLQPHMQAVILADISNMFAEKSPHKIVPILSNLVWQLFMMQDIAIPLGLTSRLFNYLDLDRKIVNPEWLDQYNIMARLLDREGQYEAAAPIFEQLLQISEQELDTHDESRLSLQHEHRLSLQHELALTYRRCGRLTEAVAMLEHLVKIKQQTLAEDHWDRLVLQQSLAISYQDNGQINEAIALLEHIVRIGENKFAQDHAFQLAHQHTLASAYRINGQIKEAVTLLEHVVKLKRQKLAEDHRDRLASENNLAICYWDLGQRELALQLMRRVVELRQRSLPENHPARQYSEDWLEDFESEIADTGHE